MEPYSLIVALAIVPVVLDTLGLFVSFIQDDLGPC